MTYLSTTLYYIAINDFACTRLGGSHFTPLLLYLFDFDVLSRLIAANNWQIAVVLFIDAVKKLKSIGTKGLIICVNIIHKVLNDVTAAVNILVLYIVDAINSKLKVTRVNNIIFLAIKVLIKDNFYLKRLEERFKLNIFVPELEETE